MLNDKERTLLVKKLGREPTAEEEAMVEVMWSEHISYKSSKRHFHLFYKDDPSVYLGIGEGAGLVEISDDYLIGLALESHNHPSAIDPFNGAATGVGGIIRDIISQGCHPIALLDSIRFGPIEENHSRFLFEQVVQGIANYGNSVGVPTVGGEIEFDRSYTDNCLVNVMCVGLVRKSEVVRSIARSPGDYFVLFGSTTGRDGIHGVTFASDDLADQSSEERGSVQIGDPLTEKILIDVIEELNKNKLIDGMQDLGGGGLTCAVSEMCERGGTGCEIELNKIPLREKSMRAWEILISESQERMIITVKPEKLERVIKIIEKHEIPFSIIGKVTDTKNFVAKYNDNIVVNIPIEVLVNGFIEPERNIIPVNELLLDRQQPVVINPNGSILKEFEEHLKNPNISSKRWIYQQYDHTVQARTSGEPGPGAAILHLENGEKISLSLTSIPYQVYLDPFNGAANSAMDAIRSIVATGAKPIALVDNLNFGNPEKSDAYTEFVESIKGIAQVTNDFKIPVVGGNVSLYNETITKEKQRKKILPTPVIGAVGLISKDKEPLKQFFRKSGSLLLMIGPLPENLEGSEFLRNKDIMTGKPPKYNPEIERRSMKLLLELFNKEILLSANDIGKGGLLKTLVKMSLESNKGIEFHNSLKLLYSPVFWFAEGPGRYILEIEEENMGLIKELSENHDVSFTIIGKTISEGSWHINELNVNIATLFQWFEENIPSWMEA